ncbi:MAG: YD repeat-containing protein [Flavobacteriales bacterium]|jgi:YD repeat-containing protein|nr:YD repeat-containing protein [Flavobacteriales bacterium]
MKSILLLFTLSYSIIIKAQEKINYTPYFSYDTNYSKGGDIIYTTIKDSDGGLFSLRNYNNEGNKTEDIFYDYKGEIEKKLIFEYDKAGNLIRTTGYNSKGEQNFKDIRKYNINAQLIEQTQYGANDVESISNYEYDKNGNLLNKITYNSEGEQIWKEASKYNNIGQLIEFIEASKEDTTRYTYKYDQKGNIIEKNIYNLFDDLVWQYLFEYDEKGILVKTIENQY